MKSITFSLKENIVTIGERIAITTLEMQDLVNATLKECFARHPEKAIQNHNLAYDWTYGKINGRAILRILQEEYGWQGDIPLVRQLAYGEGIVERCNRTKAGYATAHNDYA